MSESGIVEKFAPSTRIHGECTYARVRFVLNVFVFAKNRTSRMSCARRCTMQFIQSVNYTGVMEIDFLCTATCELISLLTFVLYTYIRIYIYI